MPCFLAETTTHDAIFIFDVAIKKQNFPLPQGYAKDQNIKSTKVIFGEWTRGHVLVFSNGHPLGLCPAREFIYAPSYPSMKLTELTVRVKSVTDFVAVSLRSVVILCPADANIDI